jgi:hypothetical protein
MSAMLESNTLAYFVIALVIRKKRVIKFATVGLGRYDIQHIDAQHNDIQHNDIYHNDTQHNGTQHNDI